ncbi:uncharacterized protein [Penaeus vannamei]|uniref:uncharacterized protein n=1 Tax=Penaeus vannamei TaxID=6689 RepID=UPI00387F79F8
MYAYKRRVTRHRHSVDVPEASSQRRRPVPHSEDVPESPHSVDVQFLTASTSSSSQRRRPVPHSVDVPESPHSVLKMYPTSRYGGCQPGDLDQLYKSVCQGFDLSLFGEDFAPLAEASGQASYDESVSFVGFQGCQEQEALMPGDAFGFSGFGEAARQSPDLLTDRAYPERYGHPDHHREFTPIGEMGIEEHGEETSGEADSPWGHPSPSGSSTSSPSPPDVRSLKMYEWPRQSDPELERKRVRASKAREIRQRKKTDAARCQGRLNQVEEEIARLKSVKLGQQKRLDILNALLRQIP